MGAAARSPWGWGLGAFPVRCRKPNFDLTGSKNPAYSPTTVSQIGSGNRETVVCP